MSLEQKVEELTQAIKSLPAELAGILNSGASARPEKQPEVESASDGDVDIASKGAATVGGGNADEAKTANAIAGRKTYVWDKQAKEGQVIEKGEEVPTGEHLQTVGKTNWEKMCTKYELDPATGRPLQAEEEAGDDDLGDLDDLDGDTTSEEATDGGDDDLDDGLGLDDDEEEETGVSYDDVKKQMVTVMKKRGREIALKVFKNFGARNLDEVKKEDYQAIFDLAGKQIAKAE